MTDFWATSYENWSDSEQRLFDKMVDDTGTQELYDDIQLQTYVDVLYNGTPGTLPTGNFYNDIHSAMVEYVWDTYGYNFDDVWDWDAWREAYGSD